MLSLSFHSSTAPDCMQLLGRAKLKSLLQAVERCSMLLSHVISIKIMYSILYGEIEKVDIIFFGNDADNSRHALFTRSRCLSFLMGRSE